VAAEEILPVLWWGGFSRGTYTYIGSMAHVIWCPPLGIAVAVLLSCILGLGGGDQKCDVLLGV